MTPPSQKLMRSPLLKKDAALDYPCEVVNMRCKKCGSQIFLVDETITHLEIDGGIVKKSAAVTCTTETACDAPSQRSMQITLTWMTG